MGLSVSGAVQYHRYVNPRCRNYSGAIICVCLCISKYILFLFLPLPGLEKLVKYCTGGIVVRKKSIQLAFDPDAEGVIRVSTSLIPRPNFL